LKNKIVSEAGANSGNLDFLSNSQFIKLKHGFQLMNFLSEHGDRLTVRQVMAFLYFALKDALGEAKSLNDLRRMEGFSNMLTRSLDIFLVQEEDGDTESLGWLFREAAPDDKRRILIRLTDEGKAACKGIASMLG